MADASSLAAGLLGIQARKPNPLTKRFEYGSDLMKAGADTSPVRSPLEGLARALQAGVGGWVARDAVDEQKAQEKSNINALATALGAKSAPEMTEALKGYAGDTDIIAPMLMQAIGDKQRQFQLSSAADSIVNNRTGGGAAPTGNTFSVGPAGPYAGAISGIESNGQPNNGYGAVGPVANQQGSRAYGKYQVLDVNIGPWTKEVLGQEMTPEQFLANPQAQDAVFKAKFGQLVAKHGPEGAARAWFAGEGGMNNPNASDVNGMTVAGYGQRFTQATGGQPQATPQAPPLPGNIAPPQIPNTPKPQLDPQEVIDFANRMRAGEFGSDPNQALQGMRKAMDDEIQKRWAQAQERDKMDYSQKLADYTAQRGEAFAQARESGKPPSNEQALAGGFADRMANSNGIIEKLGTALAGTKDRLVDMRGPFGIGIPGSNFALSKEYQQARQARDDFINAQLRRESGAAISDAEYERANQQYFPQPGDSEEVLKQKALNRRLAIEGMIRGAGPSYKPSASVGASPAPTGQGAAPQSAPADVPVYDLNGKRIK